MGFASTTDRRIWEFVRYTAGADRADISRQLGLPGPTVSSAVRRLLGSGDIVDMDAEAGRSSVGRGRHLLRASGTPLALGLLQWRSRRLGAALYTFGGELLYESVLDPPPPEAGPDGLCAAIDALIAAAAERGTHALSTVVIGAPAPVLRGVGASKGLAVAGPINFDDHLSKRYQLTVMTENDANLAALGELFRGPDRARNFIYIKFANEGLGSALVVNGGLVRGARGFAGELAHLQIDRDGPLCQCGGRGCLWGQVRDLTMHTATHQYRQPVNLDDLAGMAHNGDAGAARMLTDIGRALGQPLGHICTVLDPELLIIDSSTGPSIDNVVAGLRESFSIYAPPAISQNIQFRLSKLGADAELYGALEIPRETTRN